MRKIFSAIVVTIMFIGVSYGQDPYSPDYQTLKEKGLIEQPAQVQYNGPITPILPDNSTRDNGFYVPLDGTFTLAMSPNDDGYTPKLTLPFTFCFYESDYTQFYINNNGNISFDSPYATYTPTGFPVNGYAMVAPFWADVDTRGGNGAVWYKMTTNPNRLVVIWNEVGYYYISGDKRNTFQLIITDGNDPLIGIGHNVAFAYGSMEWTTGDASGGYNGFGGSPATVGINRGNGVDFALVGRFRAPGTDFIGVTSPDNQVGWLTGKRFAFNACVEDPIIPPPEPPAPVPLSNWALYVGIALMLTFVVIRFRRIF
ncbi:MAG: nidogen-like domain-containing protein [Bacteroidales bacterium]